MTDKTTSLDDHRLMDASELGKLLGRGSKSINVDAGRNPESLPPRFKIPGTKKNKWRVKDVRDWLEALAELQAEARQRERAFAKSQGIKETPPSRPFHLGEKHLGTSVTARLELKRAKETT